MRPVMIEKVMGMVGPFADFHGAGKDAQLEVIVPRYP